MPPSIIFDTYGDVNGDRIQDKIYLIGTIVPDSPFIRYITLVIQDGRTGRFVIQKLEENAGYNPRIFLGDFTGDGVNDILISIDSGGSGAFMYHYIYTFVNGSLQLIFDFNKYNREYEYVVTYKDFYKVNVFSKYNELNYILDLSNRDSEYLNDIYNKNGKLKRSIEGFVNPLSGLYPIDFNGDQVYDLLAYQKIAGMYNADALGYVQNTLTWDKNQFGLSNQQVAINGN